MLPYALQVSELEKIARLEEWGFEPARKAPLLDVTETSHDVPCLVCNEPAAGSCAACRSVSYCSPEHQRTDARWHDHACGHLGEAREDALFRAGCSPEELARRLLAQVVGLATIAEPAERRVFTDLASRALTIAGLLEDLELFRDEKAGGAVRIHVVGASAKELETPLFYAELARRFPQSRFELVLVGPELPSVRLEPLERVSFSLHAGEYRRELWTQFARPDLVLGFNAGLLLYRSWIPTLRELVGSGMRVAFTTYRVWEAKAEAELLGSAGVACLRPPAPNPFRSLSWRRSSTIANDASQDNSYVSVWRF